MATVNSLEKRIALLNARMPRLAPVEISDETSAMSPRGKVLYCARLGIEGLFERAQQMRGRMTATDCLNFVKALTTYQRIIDSAPDSMNMAEEEDYSGFSDDELRQYSEFSERARKVTIDIDTRDMSREQVAKMKAFALETRGYSHFPCQE